MKKIFTIAAIASMFLAGCTNDSFIDGPAQKAYDVNNLNIGFNVSNNNLTRATNDPLQTKGHYEFGVFGYSGAHADYDGEQIMENYLVAFGSLTNPYKDLASGASTWMAGSEQNQLLFLATAFLHGSMKDFLQRTARLRLFLTLHSL